MSKHLSVSLTDDQRAALRTLTGSGCGPARAQTRARILLLADRSQGEKRPDAEIAATLLVSLPTIGKTRRRFALAQAAGEDALAAALSERPRPGQRPKMTGDIEAHLVTLACSDPPEGAARWTLRLLADRIVAAGHLQSLSHVTVGERLKKMHSSRGKSSPGV